MGNKSGKQEKYVKDPRPPPKLDPLEETLSGIISRDVKQNDIRYKDLYRFSQRVSIFDGDEILVDKGLTTADIASDADEKQDASDLKWLHVKNILLHISRLFSKYNPSETNANYHSKLASIFDLHRANNSNELYAMIMNGTDNFGAYAALNIPSALCQSNAQVAFTYLTFKYLSEKGYDALSDVPGESGWLIHIYFNEGSLRVLHKKQGAQTGKVKGKTETQFVIDWEMDVLYDKEAVRCRSVELKTTGISHVNPKLKKKVRERIKRDLNDGHHVVYTAAIFG